MKKVMVIAAAVVLCVAAGFAWRLFAPRAVGVSELKANPERNVGKVEVRALAGRTDPANGLLEIADEKACCALLLDVPFTEDQRTRLRSEHLYRGVLPDKGTPLEVLGTLGRLGAGYTFTVDRVSSAGKAVIKRL